LVVTGSEIVGLIPFEAILQAGKFYLKQQGKSTGIPVEDIIETAIYSMGLNDVSPFNPTEKIIGLPETPANALVEMKTSNFVHEVSRDTPAPGGGSIAALSGALGAALTSMVSNITAGKGEYEDVREAMMEIAEKVQNIKDKLLRAVDEDTTAFNAYMEARRLPQNTEEEKKKREAAIQDGLKQAVKVPFNTAQLSFEALKLANRVALEGFKSSITDAGVGAYAAYTGVIGGIYNILINLPQIKDEKFKSDMRSTCATLEEEARKILSETVDHVKKHLV